MNKDVLIRLSDAIAYFNWPLGDKVTQSHVRSLREAADALEAELEALSDKDYPEYEGITDFINCMFDYAKVIEPIDSDSAAHELVVQNVLLANDQTDALEAADKRIEELESDLNATQENEYRLAEANKPLLARAFKADKRIAELRAALIEIDTAAAIGAHKDSLRKVAREALKEQVDG